MSTSIEWTDATWNPTRGCSLVSPGCTNCYAMKFAHRFSGKGKPYEGLTKLRDKGGPVWTGEVRLIPDQLAAPLGWKKPRRVFVNSMSDLFHTDLRNEEIAAIFAVMAACPQHTFQILTKRPENMLAWFEWIAAQGRELPGIVGEIPPDGTALEAAACTMMGGSDLFGTELFHNGVHAKRWPLPNVWLGVSVEDQKHADARIPLLLKTPAAVRFVSAEPLLEEVDLTRFMWPTHWSWDARYRSPEDAIAAGAYAERKPQQLVGAGRRFLDWVIVGGESGPGARPFSLEWVEQIRIDCERARVPVFVKQLGSRAFEKVDGEGGLNALRVRLNDPKGGDWDEWPWRRLRVRQFPEARS